MSPYLYAALVWLALGLLVALAVGRTVRIRDAHEAPRRPSPAFRFGSGPLAGVGVDTRRPWVKR